MSEPVLMPLKTNISSIKNKHRRAEAYKKLKKEKTKAKKEERQKIRKQRELLGEEAVPKGIPKTIENQRVYDETLVSPSDEELIAEEANDELGIHLNSQVEAKVLITTCDHPSMRTSNFCRELRRMIPQSEFYFRRALSLKGVTKSAIKRGYTGLIIINEDRKTPNGMIITHLPDGPTANFRLSNVKFSKEIKRSGALSDHWPELILNNFNTQVGRRIGRMLVTLFPRNADFSGRRVVTFHNQRDYIFFRQHRYQFRSEKKVGIQELGPRFTLKLRSLQKGTFDSKFGQYEWIVQREKNRRKFTL